MKSVLIDVGRHKIRFGLMNSDDAIVRYYHELTSEAQIRSDTFLDFVSSVITDVFQINRDDVLIAIATPGPFHGDIFQPMYMPQPSHIRQTNWWPSKISEFRQALGEYTYVFHDMAALAVSISQLREDDLVTLNFRVSDDQISDGFMAEQPNQSTLYIQTSVGLGVSALIPTEEGGRIPFSSEGASDTLAPYPNGAVPPNPYDPEGPDEWFVYANLSKQLSETGAKEFGCMTALYLLHPDTFVKMHQILGGTAGTPEDVTALAFSGDATAIRTLKVYAGFLATFAGNMAYAFRAYDGVYIGGSLPTELVRTLGNKKLSARVRDDIMDHFQSRLSKRERQNTQLRNVPVTIIVNENNALLGLRDLVRGLRGMSA